MKLISVRSNNAANKQLIHRILADINRTSPPYFPTTPNTTFSFQQIEKKFQAIPDGAPRIIKVEKRTIKYKKTTAKNLLA